MIFFGFFWTQEDISWNCVGCRMCRARCETLASAFIFCRWECLHTRVQLKVKTKHICDGACKPELKKASDIEKTCKNWHRHSETSCCEATVLTARRCSVNKHALLVLEVKGICQWGCGWLVWTWATSSVPTVLPWQLVRLHVFCEVLWARNNVAHTHTHEMAKP